jgi:hypothetical protein
LVEHAVDCVELGRAGMAIVESVESSRHIALDLTQAQLVDERLETDQGNIGKTQPRPDASNN